MAFLLFLNTAVEENAARSLLFLLRNHLLLHPLLLLLLKEAATVPSLATSIYTVATDNLKMFYSNILKISLM